MANNTPFVRKDIWSLETTANPFDPITLAYAKAVAVMQSRPKTDPTSWSYQAAVHGINTSVFGPPPSGATWNQCKHGSWYFLPWHRMFVYYFERIVRKAVLDAGGPQDFALPYWNYNSAFPGNTLPIAFRTPTLPDGSPNALFLAAPMRNAPVMQGGQFPTQYTNHDDAFRSTAFGAASGAANAFGGYEVRPVQFSRSPHGLLESTPHDAIHVLVGGQGDPSGQCGFALMTDPDCAANDPIFWLHHANIDRLWNDWIQQGGGRLNPTDHTWLNQSFVFHDENGARVTMTCSQVLDTANQLSYVYDDAPAPVAAGGVPHAQMVIPPTQPPSGPPELMGASETPLPLTGSSATVALNMPQSTQAVFASALTTRPRRLFVSVDDIEAEVAPGFPYAVYLVCGNGDREHIGNVSLFGLRAMKDPTREHDDGDPGFRHVFEVTAAVAALRARGSFNQNNVSVTFEPVTMQPPPGQQATPEMLDTSHPVVRIGRVSLFAA